MSRVLSINSNVSSLIAQRHLARAADTLASTFEKLASGQRINRASDDAAGLAVSSSLKLDTRIYAQGMRNLNDGVSALNIADGAIESLSGIMTRLQELAEQAANGTYSWKQRASLDAEAQALAKEYFRIARTTKFNGVNLFDGSVQGLSLQTGYGAAGSILSSLGGNLGTGSFQARTSYTAVDSPVTSPYSVILGDLNNDGFIDMITTNTGESKIGVLLGNGDGSFRAKVAYNSGTSPRGAVLGDFNGDGTFDIATADSGTNTVSILIGNGDGSFKARTSFITGNAPQSVAVGDLNGDGILDVVSADSTASQASVLLGNGDGSFGARASYDTGLGTIFVSLGDVNGDNISDIVTANSGDMVVSVMLGNGNGTFRARTSFNTGTAPGTVVLGDLNGDGNLDMITPDQGNATVSVFLGNGNGTFNARISFSTGNVPRSVALGDLNGDGILDITSADGNDDKVSVLLGNGNGTFMARSSFTTGDGPQTVALGDLNRDGVLDLVTADNNTALASVLLATTRDGISPLLPFSLKTIADARQAMSMFSYSANNLILQRGEIGAFQSRLFSAIATAHSSVVETQGAESRISDADMAEESSRLVSTQILQQAASAVLSQANQSPLLALRLLQ